MHPVVYKELIDLELCLVGSSQVYRDDAEDVNQSSQWDNFTRW